MSHNINAYVSFNPMDLRSVSLAKSCIDSGKKFNIDIRERPGIFKNFMQEIDEHNLRIPVNPDIREYFFNILTDNVPRFGVLGAFMSYYYILYEILFLNQTSLIMEHDALIVHPIDDVLNLITDEYDVIHLDPACLVINEGYNNSNDYMMWSNPNENLKIIKLTDQTHTHRQLLFKDIEDVTIGNFMHGAHGLIVTPKGARKLINWIHSNFVVPADVWINTECVNIGYTNKQIVKINDEISLSNNSNSTTAFYHKSLTKEEADYQYELFLANVKRQESNE